MILTKFKGLAIHGYLDFDLGINEKLTFLTGINGSGKTTVLNSIVSLLSPRLKILADLDYYSIEIEFSHNDIIRKTRSTKEGDKITLSCSEIKDVMIFYKYSPDPDTMPHRESEYEAEHYREVLSNASENPVIKFITDLPTPMFLGLDRRGRFAGEADRPRTIAPSLINRSNKRGRNIFSQSLAQSLWDATTLAETSYRDTLIETRLISDKLRKELILNLLAIDPVENYGMLSIPKKEDIEKIATMKKQVRFLPEILNIPPEEVAPRIIPLLDLLLSDADKIPKNTTIKNFFGEKDHHPDVSKAILNWSFNNHHLKRIQTISNLIEEYNEKFRDAFSASEKYLQLVNGFLKDSGKTVSFDSKGYILFKNDKNDESRPLASLSSGEAQIFVILTHLLFNPNALSANVFIIDEPELSLHVHWQEKFIDSVISANSNVQYLLATHSPSIILEKTDKCIDLGSARRL